MCGIVGGFSPHRFQLLRDSLPAMTQAIAHRGPDASGNWLDEGAGVALGHRRLAIVDLSPQGNQPMVSASGRYAIVFNGEIYNHLALRERLQGNGMAPSWRGHSDTETLLACIEAWGFEQAIQASVGMFAIAVWDRCRNVLLLARDRFGEKPLYYGVQSGDFLFGSELKAITAHPSFERRIDRDAIALLLKHNYIPAPYSIWQGILKLPAGTWMTIHPGKNDADPVPYWSLQNVAIGGVADRLALSDVEATDALESVLGEAIVGQMVADVPLGALLSGGIDSSTVVALMQAHSRRPVKTFSIGFHESRYDESVHAAAVAKHLGTDHTTLHMTAADVLEAVPRVPEIYDEPFADSSQLPTALVMSLARKHVTVALSGDAGDELFGGYNRYILAPRIWRMMGCLPYVIRKRIAALLLTLRPDQWDLVARPFAFALQQAHVGDKLYKLGQRLQAVRTFDDFYLALVTEWSSAESVVKDAGHPAPLLARQRDWPALDSPVERMMAMDSLTYLPDDILVKVDRAAMASSLETRAPFLDHRVAGFAWRLPLSQKMRSGEGKWLLRQVLYRHVPRQLIDRPKAGFGIPLDDWLRGPLRQWAEALLSPEVLERDNLLNVPAIRSAWREHISGSRQYGYRLWSVLMLQAWLASTRSQMELPESF